MKERYAIRMNGMLGPIAQCKICGQQRGPDFDYGKLKAQIKTHILNSHK